MTTGRRRKGHLGVLSGVAILSTSLLGTGVFVLPALGLMSGGLLAHWSWLFLLLAMLPIALVFGALGGAYPHAGGVSHWVRHAAGPRFERVLAFLFLAIIPVGLPAAVDMAAIFASPFLDETSRNTQLGFKVLFLLLVYMVNRLGVQTSALLQGGIAIGMVLFVLILMTWVPLADYQFAPLASSDLNLVFRVMATLFWCFLGIEIVANLAEEFADPTRLTKVIVLSLLIAGSVYLACSLMLGQQYSQYDDAMMLNLTQLRLGAFGSLAISALGLLACFASINTYCAGFSRQIWSLADEGRLAASLRGQDRRGVPVAALNSVILVGIVSVLIFHFGFVDLESLIRLANSNFVLVYLAAMLSGVVLLRGVKRWIAAISAVVCVLVLLALGWSTLYGLLSLVFFWFLPETNAKAKSKAD